MFIRMDLARIVIIDSDEEKMSMIVLRETEGDRAFPILIGVHEAYAIQRRANQNTMHRPMTHDLIAQMIGQLSFELEQILIHELRDSTFYAKLVLRHDEDIVEIDSRPSDAIAIGAGTDTPIYVEDAVLDEVC